MKEHKKMNNYNIGEIKKEGKHVVK